MRIDGASGYALRANPTYGYGYGYIYSYFSRSQAPAWERSLYPGLQIMYPDGAAVGSLAPTRSFRFCQVQP